MEKDIDEDKAALKDVIEHLTTSGSTNFDANKLKVMKSLCKKSTENIHLAFNEIFNQLHKKHSEIRYSSICLIDELFLRSHAFREITVEQIENILNLTLTSEKPLPPPKAAAKLVKDKTRTIIKNWCDKYATCYVKLSLAVTFITPDEPVTTEPITERQIQNNIFELETINLQKNKEMQYKNLKNTIDQELPEIIKCLIEVESCFTLLVPRFDREEQKEDIIITEQSPREIGKLTNDYSLEINLNRDTFTTVVIKESEDNNTVIQNLKERVKIFRKKYLKSIRLWMKRLKNLEANQNEINHLKNVVLKINACLKKFEDIKVDKENDSDDSEEFEEVEEKEYYSIFPITKDETTKTCHNTPETSSQGIKKPSPMNLKLTADGSVETDVNVWKPLRKDDDIADPASYTLALSKLKKIKPVKSNKLNEAKSADNDISDLPDLYKIAPVVPYQHDLLEWDEERKKELRENISLGSAQEMDIGHRFWSTNDRGGQGVCDAAMSSLTSRSFAFVGEFKPVEWSCRAPLESGKLCPRMDRKKCPFHGKIIPRDKNGTPTNAEDFERLKKLEEEKEKNKVPDWQDPKLLAELKEKTGLDLKMPQKGRRGKKKTKKYENLTDISKKSTSKTRLKNKVLSKGAMKRVSAVMDRMDAKKSYDKFGNNFNYALKE